MATASNQQPHPTNVSSPSFNDGSNGSRHDAMFVDDDVTWTEDDYRFYSDLHQVAVPAIFFFIIVVGLVGNSLVVVVTLSRPKMRSSIVSLLLLNLAASDLIFLIVCVPFMAYHYAADNWLLGEAVCKLAQYALYVTVYVTVYTLVAIAIIRFVRIVRWPNRSSAVPDSRSRVGLIVAVIWTTMLTVNSPVLFLYRVKIYSSSNPDDEPYYFCGLDSHDVHGPRLSTSFFAFAYVGPLSIIATMYVLILRFLRNRRRHSMLDRSFSASSASTRSARRSARSAAGSLNRRRGAATSETAASEAGGAVVRSRERRRTSYATRVFLAVVVVFGLCWFPLHAHLLFVMFVRQPTTRSYAVWRVVCHSLAYANSSVNPFIYHYVSADFRRSMQAVAAACAVRCRRLIPGPFSSGAVREGVQTAAHQRDSCAPEYVDGPGAAVGNDESAMDAVGVRKTIGGVTATTALQTGVEAATGRRHGPSTRVEMYRLSVKAKQRIELSDAVDEFSSQGPSV